MDENMLSINENLTTSSAWVGIEETKMNKQILYVCSSWNLKALAINASSA